MPKRRIHEKLGVPTSTTESLPKVEATEEGILKALAEDYKVNPGLYMTIEDLKERVAEVAGEKLEKILNSLEAKGMVKLQKDGKGKTALAKATYNGLRKAAPLEEYKWYPHWLDKKCKF
jgi:hypothetical protein